ncbi:hypothetical protein NDU88_002257 [Pleurodeles waltl]|uniref:Uncharacterized protein n=1 Tax=Pleurodeles waltl TaxID=8319 RepID=A0AAV7MAH3_PLEWA|nr:hypothetical protein NDU88_002257 [Pleurodeles waltl]
MRERLQAFTAILTDPGCGDEHAYTTAMTPAAACRNGRPTGHTPSARRLSLPASSRRRMACCTFSSTDIRSKVDGFWGFSTGYREKENRKIQKHAPEVFSPRCIGVPLRLLKRATERTGASLMF